MKVKKKHTVRNTIIFMVVLAVGIIAVYWSITNRTEGETNEDVNLTQAETLLQKDIEHNYPKTPKEVLKLYSQITKCMYNDSLDDTTFKALLEKKRNMFDEELLEKNPFELQYENLKIDIEEYRKNKKVIVNYAVDKSSIIEGKKIEDQEMAQGSVEFFIKNAMGYEKINQIFILRKAQNKEWKILGWTKGNTQNEQNVNDSEE